PLHKRSRKSRGLVSFKPPLQPGAWRLFGKGSESWATWKGKQSYWNSSTVGTVTETRRARATRRAARRLRCQCHELGRRALRADARAVGRACWSQSGRPGGGG